MNSKKWFTGLKWAEEVVQHDGPLVGSEKIKSLCDTGNDPFDRGALDYLHTETFQNLIDLEFKGATIEFTYI
jgi:hypothetical protein